MSCTILEFSGCTSMRPSLQLPAGLQYLCLEHMLPSRFSVPPGCQIFAKGRACCQETVMGQSVF